MFKQIVAATLVLTLGSITASAQTAPMPQMGRDVPATQASDSIPLDMNDPAIRQATMDGKSASGFMMAAAKSDLTESQLSEVALRRASSRNVQDFAKFMVQEHGKTSVELMQIARTKNVTLPTTLSPEDQQAKADLEGRTGATFEQLYVAKMVKGHEKAVALFQSAATQNEDPELRAFANKHLADIQQHLRDVSRLSVRARS
ncbi:DUF4142 domain-containing protein [Candidatus Cyanaurora vandensis]|uniref:DUF4142 domain-containing protein n=1 Tax=Candidatus Cyanaurora vandensis TaxID=2714958 RepID=UPI00257A7E75|nr:DUF4142 domain-containing protein [Candidatus Cyanaurora vandensis]